MENCDRLWLEMHLNRKHPEYRIHKKIGMRANRRWGMIEWRRYCLNSELFRSEMALRNFRISAMKSSPWVYDKDYWYL